MKGFDPAAEFLLDWQWQNLFEPASARPTNTFYRCKGCDAIVSEGVREKHHRAHVRERQAVERRRQEAIRRNRLRNLELARRGRAPSFR